MNGCHPGCGGAYDMIREAGLLSRASGHAWSSEVVGEPLLLAGRWEIVCATYADIGHAITRDGRGMEMPRGREGRVPSRDSNHTTGASE